MSWKKGGGSESTIISMSFLICSGLRAPQLRKNVLDLARFRAFVPKLLLLLYNNYIDKKNRINSKMKNKQNKIEIR